MVHLVREQRPGPARRDPTRPRRAVHPSTRRPTTDGLLGQHVEARRARLLPLAHIDGLIGSDPAVYARLPKVHRNESRTQGLDRRELIRFLQVAQTITVHHGALAYLLGINALRASEAATVKIEDYADTLRGYRVLHLVGKGNKPATMPLTVPVVRVLEVCRGERATGPLVLRPVSGQPVDRRDVYRSRPDRQDRRHPTPHQSALATACRDHQRPGRGRPAARRADLGPARGP